MILFKFDNHILIYGKDLDEVTRIFHQRYNKSWSQVKALNGEYSTQCKNCKETHQHWINPDEWDWCGEAFPEHYHLGGIFSESGYAECPECGHMQQAYPYTLYSGN